MTDINTSIEEIKKIVDDFRKERNWNPEAKNLAISITLEAAELLEHYQWDDSKESKIEKEEIRKEFADILIYCLEFAVKNDIDISEAIIDKLKHNAKKYPAKIFSRKNKKNTKKYYQIKKKYRGK